MEKAEIFEIADIIEKASRSLFSVIKYVYIISKEDFYNINVKDIFKIALRDITNVDILSDFKSAFNSAGDVVLPEFEQARKLIHYAFAIRLPFWKRYINNIKFSKNICKKIFALAVANGAENFGNIIDKNLVIMIKFSKKRLPEPVFDGEWFRRWVYFSRKELSAINNSNIFLLGCVETLFPLYYSALIDKIKNLSLN